MNNKLKFLLLTGLVLIVLAILFNGCKKEDQPPHNPYDDVVYVTPPSPVDTLDPKSFVALHKNILHPKCSKPGCHDGNFEPDFRTIQSSYSTLVYHSIIKNNEDSTFQYRVVPYDTAMSILHERITNCCFVNQDDRMPQDNIGVPLPAEDINIISQWILDGAKDMFGQLPTYPNQKPNVIVYIAVSTDFVTVLSDVNNRIDSVYYNPFIMPPSTQMYLAFVVEDDSTAVANLQVNKVKMSYDPDDFSASAPGYKEYVASYSNLGGDNEGHLVLINTGDFASDKVVYMRYYVNDGDHSENVEFPNDASILAYKTFYSFYVTQ